MGFRLEAVKKPFRSHHQCRSLQLSRGVKLKNTLEVHPGFSHPFCWSEGWELRVSHILQKDTLGLATSSKTEVKLTYLPFFWKMVANSLTDFQGNSKCEQKARKRSLFTMIRRGVWTKIIDMLQSIAPVLKSLVY